MKAKTHGMPHRHLRRSRIKRLMGAGWFPYGPGGNWKHPQHPELMVSMPRALKLQAGWDR